MKTVSGIVLSSKPVSLSKAARVLSKFVASDNGASPAFAAYLKRTSTSFDELVQLRKEQRRALKKQDQEDINGDATGDGKVHKKNKKGKEESESSGTGVVELTDIINGGSEHNRINTESNEGKNKKRSRAEKEKESGIKVEIEEADNKQSRKRKHRGSGHGRLDDSEEQHISKKKSRKKMKYTLRPQ